MRLKVYIKRKRDAFDKYANLGIGGFIFMMAVLGIGGGKFTLTNIIGTIVFGLLGLGLIWYGIKNWKREFNENQWTLDDVDKYEELEDKIIKKSETKLNQGIEIENVSGDVKAENIEVNNVADDA